MSEKINRTPDEIIEEFFVKDGIVISNNKTRRSVFLSLEKDLKFLRGLDLKKPPLSLTKEQQGAFNKRIPSFGFILVFCSSIDVLARVWKRRLPDSKRKTRSGKIETTGVFFKAFSRRWYKLTDKQTKELYSLRNSVSHQYVVGKKQGAHPFGFSGIMKRGLNSSWLFNLNGMYSAFTKGKREMISYVKSLSAGRKEQLAIYIEQNGFYWVPNPIESEWL